MNNGYQPTKEDQGPGNPPKNPNGIVYKKCPDYFIFKNKSFVAFDAVVGICPDEDRVIPSMVIHTEQLRFVVGDEELDRFISAYKNWRNDAKDNV